MTLRLLRRVRSYNDARDPELVRTVLAPFLGWRINEISEILYERLILVDQVHALLSPFANSIPAFALARTYGVRSGLRRWRS